jgi:hypothetical protein
MNMLSFLQINLLFQTTLPCFLFIQINTGTEQIKHVVEIRTVLTPINSYAWGIMASLHSL